jgi:hypothetical protein
MQIHGIKLMIYLPAKCPNTWQLHIWKIIFSLWRWIKVDRFAEKIGTIAHIQIFHSTLYRYIYFTDTDIFMCRYRYFTAY